MKINKKHKTLIKKLKNHSKCTVTPDDIYNQTNFFKEEQTTSKTPYKLAFMVSLVIIFLSLTITTFLSVQNYKLKNKEPKVVYIDKVHYIIDDSKGIPQEEKENIKVNNTFFCKNAFSSYQHDKKIIFFLYYGYNVDNEGFKTYFYYYAFSNLYAYDSYLKISVNNSVINITNENRYGILTTLNEKETTDFTISFIVETSNRKCEYVVKNCNY